MIDLYAMTSPNVVKVTIMLEEVAETYRLHFIDVFREEQFTPEFMAMSPTAKVPVMIDQDATGGPLTVFESGAILLYLAEKHGVLLPTEVHARSRALQWLMMQVGYMGPMAGQAVHFTRFAPEGNAYGKERYYSQSASVHKLLNKRLSEAEFIAGDIYGVADIAIYPWVSHATRFFPWLADGAMAEMHPNLWRWFEQVTARPAVQRGIHALDDIAAKSRETQKTATQEAIDRFVLRGAHSANPVAV